MNGEKHIGECMRVRGANLRTNLEFLENKINYVLEEAEDKSTLMTCRKQVLSHLERIEPYVNQA